MTYPFHYIFAPVLVLVSLVLAGCGDCAASDAEIHGVVLDEDGRPLDGVEVTTCAHADNCTKVSDGDSRCTTVRTDPAGRFTLLVTSCRPAPFECELRPLLLEREGCDRAVVRVALSDSSTANDPTEFVHACSPE